MKELIDKLNKYSYEYYTLDSPSVSDEVYDSEYDKLVKLEKETGIILSNSPTQRVGYEIKSELSKIKHKYPLKSLDKTKDIKALERFLKGREGVLMLKLDGLTNELIYKDGKLVEASTRGNGEIGEDILHNVKTYTNIPLTIPCKDEVRIIGEAIITYDVFNKINKNGEFKNPRNTVAGSVRQLNSKICKDREVKFIAYNVYGVDFKTKTEELDWIEREGFQTVEWDFISSIDSKEILETIIENLKQFAKDLDIPIDGLVLTFNDLKYANTLGSTSHHPLHSIAFKFNEDVEITILREVEWQVGRTGVITPVGIFDEVELAGTTVSRASLHNLNIIKELKLGIGNEICVVKKNEIIPQIKENITKSNSLEIPKVCPSCGQPTRIEITDNAEFLICTNPNCKAKLVQKISHYVSRNALNIDGLSSATLEKFIEKGFVESIVDLYTLEQYKKEIIHMEGFGLKSYNNLINSIEKSKQCKLENFIFGLGLEGVGLSTSKDLVSSVSGNTGVDKITEIKDMQICDFMRVKDIGGITASNIYNWFYNDENINLLETLLGYLEFIEEEKVELEIKENPLLGKSVYPTGKFSLKKDELKAKLELLGAKVENGYKKSLDYLICGGDTSKSGKVDRAIEDNVKLMSEKTLLEMLGGLN